MPKGRSKRFMLLVYEVKQPPCYEMLWYYDNSAAPCVCTVYSPVRPCWFGPFCCHYMGWGCVGCNGREDSPCGSTPHWKPLLVPWSPSPGSSPDWCLMSCERSPAKKTKYICFVFSFKNPYLYGTFTVGPIFWYICPKYGLHIAWCRFYTICFSIC